MAYVAGLMQLRAWVPGRFLLTKYGTQRGAGTQARGNCRARSGSMEIHAHEQSIGIATVRDSGRHL